MRGAFLAFSIAALSVVAWPAAPASAQDSKTAKGTVTSIDGASVTVKVGGQDMKFAVDAKTVVEAKGAGTKDRAAEAKGAAGPKLTDVIKVGQAVAVTYTGVGASVRATRILEIASVGGGGTAAPSAPPAMTVSGTVTAVAADSVTISGANGAQTFAIGADTKVVGTGAGTAAAAKGGKIAVTDLVGKGDRITVSYRTMGATMHAAEIRVTGKAKG